MSFNELVLAMESAEDRYDLTMEKTCQVIDHAFDSFKLLCEEIELELLTEAESTKAADKDKASEGLIVKIGNAIKHFIETIKNFVLDVADSIAAFFSKEDNKQKIGEIEQIVNSNSELKSKKINIPDEKAISSLVDEYSDKCQREVTMIKAGRKPDKTAGELRSEFESKKSTAIKATVVVTLSAAIGILIAFTKKSKNDIVGNTGLNESVKTIEKNKDGIGRDIDPEQTKQLIEFTKLQMELAKTKAKAVGEFAKDIFSGVKAGITGSKPVNPNLNNFPKNKKETRKAQKDATQEYINRATANLKNKSKVKNESEESGDELDDYLQSIMEEVESSLSEIDEKAVEVDESFFDIPEELQNDVNALKLEIFEAAHNGEITEEEKNQFLSFLNLENYGY